MNYIRCHNDLGWTFLDEDIRVVGIDPFGHRGFLNPFDSLWLKEFMVCFFGKTFARGIAASQVPTHFDKDPTHALGSCIAGWRVEKNCQ